MLGIAELRRLLGTPGWTVDAAEALTLPLQSVDLLSTQDDNILGVAAFYCAFVGSAAACTRGTPFISQVRASGPTK